MDGWMDGLFFFCLSSTHTTLPLIKLVERSKLFQTSFVSFFFLSLSLSRVCFVIDRSRGGTGNVWDLSNLPAGMLLVATLVCV